VRPPPLHAPPRLGRGRPGLLGWGGVGSVGHCREGRGTLSPARRTARRLAGCPQRASHPVGGPPTVALSGPSAQPAAPAPVTGSPHPKFSQPHRAVLPSHVGCAADDRGVLNEMPIAGDYPFLDVLWTMIIFFCWVASIWILITVFVDIFRRDDMGGWGKAGWVVFTIVLPFLGVLIYLIAQHDGMRRRSMRQAEAQKQAFDDYVREAAGGPSPRSPRPRSCLTRERSPRTSSTRSRRRRSRRATDESSSGRRHMAHPPASPRSDDDRTGVEPDRCDGDRCDDDRRRRPGPDLNGGAIDEAVPSFRRMCRLGRSAAGLARTTGCVGLG
jgi:Phospholipase_D-nuclease N-terminal